MISKYIRDTCRSVSNFYDTACGNIRISHLFVFFALPLVLFLAVNTPLFCTPDEIDHVIKAYKVFHEGDTVDEAILKTASLYVRLTPQLDRTATRSNEETARTLHWSRTKVAHTSQIDAYPFFLYFIQAIVISVCSFLNISIFHTVVAIRAVAGCMAVLLAAYAISTCRQGKLALYGILLLPMSLAQMASSSQDAFLIPLCALFAALVSRQLDAKRPFSTARLLGVLCLLTVVSLARPPYIAFALLLFLPGLVPNFWGGRVRSFGVALGACFFIAVMILIYMKSGGLKAAAFTQPTGYKVHLSSLFHDPLLFVRMLLQSFKVYGVEYYRQFIGVLGWLDTPLPFLYYKLTSFMLLSLCVVCLCSGQKYFSSASMILFSAGICLLLIFVAEFIIWTPQGDPVIEGVQGRYFIPLAIVAAIGLPRILHSSFILNFCKTVVVLFPFITMIYLPKVVLFRFYLK